MEINKNIIKNKKKFYEYKSSFISMKEDELQKIGCYIESIFSYTGKNGQRQ